MNNLIVLIKNTKRNYNKENKLDITKIALYMTERNLLNWEFLVQELGGRRKRY